MREWLYGRNPVYEVLRSGRRDVFRLWVAENAKSTGRLKQIIELCTARNIPIERVPRQKLSSINDQNQGVAAQASGFSYCDLTDILTESQKRNEPPLVLILDSLQDPQNLGALLRTAEIVGVHGVILPFRHAASITPAVVNASSGASEYLNVAQMNLVQAMTALKGEDVWIAGLEAGKDAKLPSDVRLDGAVALVVGSEGHGMRKLVRDTCDYLLKLPMRGKIESLNASVAGSVALYLLWQARGYSGGK